MRRVVVVGTVVGVHGLKGEVKVAPANGDPHRFRHLESVLISADASARAKGTAREAGGSPGPRGNGNCMGTGNATGTDSAFEELAIESQRAQAGKGHAVLKLAGIDDAEAAERLRGEELFLAEDDLPPLEEGEYYSFMLVGMDCVDEDGRLLGKVSEVLDRPANDVIVVEAADGGCEYLIPAVEDYVVKVDIGARRLTVRNRPGLR
ncbi:MAG: Ribosome maturation factor RimM [Firmicutes bacterium ADurb.Bin506]|nr:MAG: Ribosome maturation factor RimM [Firmicutes bacterium ADurb.Bin506]